MIIKSVSLWLCLAFHFYKANEIPGIFYFGHKPLMFDLCGQFRLKKKVGNLFVLLMAGLLLTCSGRPENRIVVWHSMRPVARKILADHLARFQIRHPQWEFRELYYPNETARTNFIISALGGSGPQLFYGANDNIGPFVELRVIQPLEPFLNSTFLDSFISEPFPANTWFRGHLYQLADRVGNHLCLVYNKKMIARPPKTITELRQVGKELTRDFDGNGLPDQYAIAWNYTEPYFVVPFIGGYGGFLMDENNKPTLNTEATRKAAQLIYELVNVDKITPPECDYEIANSLFKDGLAAMIINGPWSWGSYLENNLDIGVTRIPLIDETGLWPTPLVSPMGYSLNVNTTGKHREITIALLKYLTSPKVELDFSRALASIPSRREALNSDIVQNNELIRSSFYQLEVGKVMPVVTELRWIWDAMRPSYQAIFTGKVTPAQAALNMQELAETLIRENRK